MRRLRRERRLQNVSSIRNFLDESYERGEVHDKLPALPDVEFVFVGAKRTSIRCESQWSVVTEILGFATTSMAGELRAYVARDRADLWHMATVLALGPPGFPRSDWPEAEGGQLQADPLVGRVELRHGPHDYRFDENQYANWDIPLHDELIDPVLAPVVTLMRMLAVEAPDLLFLNDAELEEATQLERGVSCTVRTEHDFYISTLLGYEVPPSPSQLPGALDPYVSLLGDGTVSDRPPNSSWRSWRRWQRPIGIHEWHSAVQ
jgi:hypothetical protein